MTTSYRLILCVTVALTAGPVAAADGPPVPMRGRVLVLDNERTVEGDIERVGGQYRVRREQGETWVPGEKVLRLCADHEDAYRCLRARANLEDADERLRLARWCLDHGLRDRALENVRAAVQLRPDHAESRRLLGSLERAASAPASVPPPSPVPPPVTPAAPELNNESLGAFASKVQPILMNACARCHTNGRGGAFQLARASEGLTAGGRSLQHNLAAVLAQVNLEQPQSSPLLTKAITAHGTVGPPPLHGKQMAAYHTLEDWVQKTVTSNPHLRTLPSAMPANEARTVALPKPATPAAEAPLAKPAEPAPVEPGNGGFAAGRAEPKPPAPPGPLDPYDPGPFNRAGQPEPKGSPARK